jgi:hypothetical protein
MDTHTYTHTHIHARTHTKRNRRFYDTGRLYLMIPGKTWEEYQTTNPFQLLHHPLKRSRVQQDYFSLILKTLTIHLKIEFSHVEISFLAVLKL